MNAWPFIITAWTLTGVASAGVAAWSYLAMRRAEAEAEKLTRR
ncbi:hypothetical protein ACFSC3_15585 [Sphingomonas floccifaciens]|uniref:Heme exporter protein D n=1 Tax=Sphingomonas floccifaciens TaxID=1844115 RepID=A0ABW4NFR4_9SPHN